MDSKNIDLAVPVAYILAVILAAVFAQAAVGPITIFGALAVAGWFSFVRPAMRARQRELARRRGEEPPTPYWH
jgi:hypothetical protein